MDTPRKSNKRKKKRTKGKRYEEVRKEKLFLESPGKGRQSQLESDEDIVIRDDKVSPMIRMKRGVSIFSELQKPKQKKPSHYSRSCGFDLGGSLRENFPNEPWGQFVSLCDEYTSDQEEEVEAFCFFCFDRNQAKWAKLVKRKKYLKKEVAEQQAKTKKLSQKVHELNTETKDLISQARDRLTHALNQNKDLKKKCEELEKAANEKDKLLSSLNANMQSQLIKTQELETKLRNSRTELSEKSEGNAAQQAKAQSMSAETKNLISQARARLTKALDDNKALKSKCKDLESSITEKEKRIKSLDDDLQSQSKKADDLTIKLGETKVELIQNVENSKVLEKKVTELNTTTKALISQASERLTTALDENVALKTKYNELEKNLEEQEKKEEADAGTLRSIPQPRPQYDEQTVIDLRDAKAQLLEKEERNIKLEKKLHYLNTETKKLIAQARDRLTNALNENKILKEKCTDLQEIINEKDRTAKSLNDNLKSQGQQASELATKLKENKEKLRLATDEKKRLDEELDELRTLREQQRDQDETIRCLKKEKATWMDESERAWGAKRELQSTYTRVRLEQNAETINNKEKIDSLTFDISMMEKKLEATEHKLKLYESRKAHYKSEAKKLQKQNASLRKKTEGLHCYKKDHRDVSDDWNETALPGFRNIRGVTFDADKTGAPAGHLTILIKDPSKKHKGSKGKSRSQTQCEKPKSETMDAAFKSKLTGTDNVEAKLDTKKKGKKDKKQKKTENKSKKKNKEKRGNRKVDTKRPKKSKGSGNGDKRPDQGAKWQ